MSLTPALFAELWKMVVEDSSTNLWKEILDQVQVLKPNQQDLSELKCDLKQTQEKMACYGQSFLWYLCLVDFPAS